LQFIPDFQISFVPTIRKRKSFTPISYLGHICGDQVLDEGWETFNEDRRYYYDLWLHVKSKQHWTNYQAAGQNLCTGHGPLVRYGLLELTQTYRQWVSKQLRIQR